ncbi:family 43 glycosylhydrolase [Kribbella sp. NPDC056861]|uniref:family 43 glycosylhydrolase n=1 Tax=Kribbella sp. NPDC056861 TaxID=3154857 RepID=UPI0034305CAF
MRIRGLLGVLLLLVGSAQAQAQAAPAPVVTIVNGDEAGATARFVPGGDAVDAHDGEIQKFGSRYYLYGTSYGCGFEWQTPGSPFCGFRSYSSTDLVNWRDEGFLFDAKTAAWQQRCNGATYGCYRPHVLYNASTGKYVLWINSYDVGVGYHVFTASSPTGPFVEQAIPKLAVNNDIPPGVNNGDHDVFRDTDGTAYLAYTDWRAGGDIIVEKLDPSYRTGTGQHARLGVRSTEAPSMFKRNGVYYLTLSDPNCGYCTTGTSYFRAAAPLGPWQGATSNSAWQLKDQALQVTGGGVGLSKAGAQWSDYDLSFRTTPLKNGSYAQAGWTFRATDAGTGYVWMLGNYPHPGAEGGNLTKAVFRNGSVQRLEVVKTPMPIVSGQSYAVRTQVTGSTIRTWVDGTLVDTTTDTSYAAGRVGFRESDGESARFDDVRVTAADGSSLLADDFQTNLEAWSPPAAAVQGVKISTDSCGGQPADVAELPGANGSTYLYQSDRWNNRAPNEALATHQWEPLRFRADGSIEPLECGTRYGIGALTADEGFHSYCDIGAGIARAQTFTAAKTGELKEVAFTTFQKGHPNASLEFKVTRLVADGMPGQTIASRTVAEADVSWSPSRIVVSAKVQATAGERFAVVAKSATTGGCYGLAYNDHDPLAGGAALYSNDNGTTWRQEQSRDLRVDHS